MPKVSVIVNCYNGEKYLKEALDSVYAQSFKDWEIVFYDNASTDNTPQIARTYDERLRYIRGESLISLGAARKEAVSLAAGEWVAFLDSDDIWYSEKLETQLKALEGGEYVLAYAGIREISAEGKRIREVFPIHQSGYLLEPLLNQFEINMVTPMFKREFALNFGLNFDPNITASEEYNLFIRMAAKGPVLVQPLLLGEYRVYQGSLTNRQISKWAFERRYTLKQVQEENPGIALRHPKAFEEAEARGSYYEARYLMSESRVREARTVMSSIAALDFRYRILWLSLFFPGVWNMLHSMWLKRYLGDLLARLALRVRRT